MGSFRDRRRAPSSKCTTKGNVNRNGERIYDMQNQRFYAIIKMDKGGVGDGVAHPRTLKRRDGVDLVFSRD